MKIYMQLADMNDKEEIAKIKLIGKLGKPIVFAALQGIDWLYELDNTKEGKVIIKEPTIEKIIETAKELQEKYGFMYMNLYLTINVYAK